MQDKFASLEADDRPPFDRPEAVRDALADVEQLLRRDSARAAECAGLRREEAAEAAEVDVLTRERADLDARAQQRREAWRQLRLGCGFEPSTPREMLAWRGRHAALLDLLRRRGEAAVKHASLQRALHDQQRALLGALAAAGALMPDETPWLTLLLHVERASREADAQSAARASREKDSRSTRQGLASLEDQVAVCDREHAVWCGLWGGAVAKLRLSPEALPEEAYVAVARLTELELSLRLASLELHLPEQVGERRERLSQQMHAGFLLDRCPVVLCQDDLRGACVVSPCGGPVEGLYPRWGRRYATPIRSNSKPRFG